MFDFKSANNYYAKLFSIFITLIRGVKHLVLAQGQVNDHYVLVLRKYTNVVKHILIVLLIITRICV